MPIPCRYLLPVLLLSGCARGWGEFRPAHGGFRVLFPGTPTERIQSLPLEPGKDVEVHEYVFERRDPDALFSVTTMALPTAPEPGPELDGWFAGRRDRVVANVHGRLVNDQTRDPTRREWRVEIPSPTPRLMVARLLVAGKRVYQVTVIMPRDQFDGEDAGKFLDSFALGPA